MFGITLAKQAISKGINFIVSLNNTAISITGVGDKLNDVEKMVTKYVAATTGSAGLAKGAHDTFEAIKCQDGVCAVISGIGCAADTLQIVGSFIPGPNITTLITTPVSVGCKVFVWCCKRGNIIWFRTC